MPLLTSVVSQISDETWGYEYDDGYRLTKATNAADIQDFVYDSLGRMRQNSRVGTYEYPDAGQPRPHAPKSVEGALYTYYANGNLQTGGGRAPVWDAENRITALGSTTTFGYDGFGERLWKRGPQGTSLYPFGDDYEITNGVTTKYLSVEGLGVIAKKVTGGSNPGTFWIHTDRLGSIDAITTESGNRDLQREYRPYGETLWETGTHTESRGWIDQRNDPETGLTYLHARYFDPKLGTFQSPDPIGVRGGLNLYAYGLGDPVNRTDRRGLKTVCVRDMLGWTREGDRYTYGGTYCYSWGDEKMNAPTTVDTGMPRGPEQPIAGDPGGKRPGDGRDKTDNGRTGDGGTEGGAGGQGDETPTPRAKPVLKNELQWVVLDASLVVGKGWDWNIGLYLSLDDPGVFFTEVDAYGFEIGVSSGVQYGSSPESAGSVEISGGWLNVGANGDPRTMNVNVYVGVGVSVSMMGNVTRTAHTSSWRWSDLSRFLNRARYCGLLNERGCR